MDVSVIVPLFNEDESLRELYEWIERVMRENNLSYEVISRTYHSPCRLPCAFFPCTASKPACAVL